MDVVELWWLSIAIGSVVVVVVAVLLGMIVSTAKRIDNHAAGIWRAGKQIAGNTVSIWLLDNILGHVERVMEEAQTMRHRATSIDEKLGKIAASRGRE